MQSRCNLCDPPHTFGSISALRKHQRAAHAERWRRGGFNPAQGPATAAVALLRQVAPDPAPPVRINHGRRFLEMALVGYRAGLERLQAEIAEVEALLARAEPPDSPATSD